jgi:farnesyl-diphosphate farnesyltransferase
VAEAPDLLKALLRDVSRSFYLSLRLLPSGVRRPIGLGYLLARATDTVADTTLVPVALRLEALASLRDRIEGRRDVPLDFSAWAGDENADATPGERVLLRRVEEAVAVLRSLPGRDAEQVRWVLGTITGGQELDLRRFEGAGRGRLKALPDAAALDDYTYRVAGCVGEFWTRLCRANLFPGARIDEAALIADGVRFGKGLQLVNILRDLPKDLANGRCYLPEDELAAAGLRPSDLLDPGNETRLWPVYERWLGKADAHLDAGWRYTTGLPRGQARVRLACALPVLIGMRTVKALRGGGVLDPKRRIKVSRAEVRGIAWRSMVRLPFGPWWDGLDSWARIRD